MPFYWTIQINGILVFRLFHWFFLKQFKTVEKMSLRLSLEPVENALDCGFGMWDFGILQTGNNSEIRNPKSAIVMKLFPNNQYAH